MESKVQIYLDLSNIVCGARKAASAHAESPLDLRLDPKRLRDVLAAGRPVASATLVMNSSVSEGMRRRFADHFSLIGVERGIVSGRDQAADELLQNEMYKAPHQSDEPGIMVLATGDGAGWGRGAGFTQPLIAARFHGFGIEVAAFRSGLHPVLRRLATMPGNALVELDDHYRSISFLEGGLRFPDPISLRHRSFATPHPLVDGELDWLTRGSASGRTCQPRPHETSGGAA